MRKATKYALAATAAAVYFFVPGYKYYVLGTWVALKIANDKGPRVLTIRKGSRQYQRLVGRGA